MKTQLENSDLTIFMEGRIDTNNAPAVETELLALSERDPGAKLTLDASALEYISSAGLRVLKKLRKQLGKPLTLKNVSPEVYEIFEATGFTELLNVRKRLREISIEGREKLGEGGARRAGPAGGACGGLEGKLFQGYFRLLRPQLRR